MRVKACEVDTVLCILEQIGIDYQGLLSTASLDGSLTDFLRHMEAVGAWDSKHRLVLDKVLFCESLSVTY